MGVPLAGSVAPGKERGDARYTEGGYFDNANPFIEPLIEPGHRHVLEVGCGAAALGGRWKRSDPGRQVWGIELDRRAAALAETRIDRVLEVDLDSVERLPEGAPLFDLIVFGDVLEHLRDPGRLLEVMARYLSPRGEVIACVPNVGHWSVVVQLLSGRFDYADEGLLDRTHIHLFTPGTFLELAADSGLGIVTLDSRVTVPGPVSETLAEAGAAMSGDPSRAPAIRTDLDTYQAVFRLRPPVTGDRSKLVVVADLSGDSTTDRVIRDYVTGFRAGEPVQLVVAVGVEDENDTPSMNHLVARIEHLLADTGVPEHEQPRTELFFHGSRRPLAEQLPAARRQVAVGPRAASALPHLPACGADRFSMLEALRAAG